MSAVRLLFLQLLLGASAKTSVTSQDTDATSTLRYYPGDVFASLSTMGRRGDGMDFVALGADGVFRVYGYKPPEFVELYVVDWRQLDPDQIKQYLEDTKARAQAAGREYQPPFDDENVPDSRQIVDLRQLLEPDDLPVVQAKMTKLNAEKRASTVSTGGPLSKDAIAIACTDLICKNQLECVTSKLAVCADCDNGYCRPIQPYVPPPIAGGSHHEILKEKPHEDMSGVDVE